MTVEPNLYCPRTNITHQRNPKNMPACDPHGWRYDVYIDADLHVNCLACLHITRTAKEGQ